MNSPIVENTNLASMQSGYHHKRLCYVVTHPVTSRFLRGQLRYMRARGYDVTLISSPGKELDQLKEEEEVSIVCVPIDRAIRPFRDLRALSQLYCVLRTIRPHIINAGSPKAGFLALLAAFFARVPVRIYTLRGLRLETTGGLTRRILTFTERIASACAHRVICVSQSVAEQFLSIGLISPQKTVVLGAGSSNGVDAANFAPTAARVAQARLLGEQLGIKPGEPVIGYVGRLTRDKGIADLVLAFTQVTCRIPTARLLLVGNLEYAHGMDEATASCILTHPRIITVGFVEDVAPYYQLMRVFAFPSFREGFPNAVLEAQASGLPVVGYRATGVVDAILDATTGRLVPVGAVGKLGNALLEYIDDPELAAIHGARGLQRVLSEFSNQRIWNDLSQEYAALLEAAGLAQPTPMPQRAIAQAA